MTENMEPIAQAQAAQAAGEAAWAAWSSHGEQMLRAPDDVTDSTIRLDDQAVAGVGTSATPEAVSPQPTSAPNVTVPTDTSQSQGS